MAASFKVLAVLTVLTPPAALVKPTIALAQTFSPGFTPIFSLALFVSHV